MIDTPPLPDDGGLFARTLLSAAAEVEAAEARIKQAVLAAAHSGDCDRVIDIMSRWESTSSCELLRALNHDLGMLSGRSFTSRKEESK